jgi:branched-chain amino acid transport system permease protein
MNTLLHRSQLVACGLIVALLAFGPSIIGTSSRGTFISFITVAIFAYSWNIVGGVLGELNLAHVVAWGIGGYGIVYFLLREQPLWQALIITLLIGAAFSAVLVLVTGVLRLEGLILAIFTLVVAEVSIKMVGEIPGLGGPVGIRLLIPQRFTVEEYHLAGVVILAVLMLITYGLLRSRRGLVWQAIREDALAAQSMGVSIRQEKVLCYALAGALGAVGGAYQAHYYGFALPETALSVAFLVIAVMCVFSGGPGTLLGPAIGAALIQGLSSLIDATAPDPDAGLAMRLAQYALAIVIIRLLISRGGGEDLLTVIVRRLTQKRTSQASGPSDTAPQMLVREPRPVTARRADALIARAMDQSPLRDELLVVSGVHKAFGGLQVLRGVDFAVAPGEFVALVGPNGAGKSTLNNVIAGVLSPDAGTLTYQGQPMGHQPAHVRFRRGVSRTFQIPRLFPQLTLLQNVALASAGNEDRARDALHRAGVRRVDRKAWEASLFEHRMVEVSRALAADASLILLDEPLAGLSPDQRDWILGAVMEEVDEDTSVVIPAIAPVVDRMMVLMDGSILANGKPDLVLNDPQVIRSYLGQPIR